MLLGKQRFRVFSSVAFYLFKLTDLLFVIFSGSMSYYFARSGEAMVPESHLVIAVLMFFVFSRELDLYRPWRGRRLKTELVLLAGVNLSVQIVFACVAMFLNTSFMSTANAQWVLLWFASSFTAQSLFRVAARRFLKLARVSGMNQRRVLLVGTHITALDVVSELYTHPEYGIQIVGYADDREKQREENIIPLQRMGAMKEISGIVERNKIDQLWITLPMRGENRAREMVEQLSYSTVSIRYVVDMNMIKVNDKSITEFSGIPLLDVDVSPMQGTVSRALKNAEDRVFACIALMLLAPLLIVLAMGVKLSSPGPVFYRQQRVSWNNQPFNILKFRSMPVDVESRSGATWARPGDNRATRFGAFIRKTSLDELPQLINVLLGDMSIVGPRPERPELIEGFKKEIPNYMKKHMVKAGITGWAQVNGYRGDTDLTKRIEHDLYYIKNWSPFFDLKIAFQTIYKGFVNKNAY